MVVSDHSSRRFDEELDEEEERDEHQNERQPVRLPRLNRRELPGRASPQRPRRLVPVPVPVLVLVLVGSELCVA